MVKRTHLIAVGLLSPVLTALLALAAEPSPAAAPGDEPEMRIRVTGLRNDAGRLRCGLFVAATWLREGGIEGVGGEIAEGVAVCRFRDVAPGTYAISTYHDENDDGRLDSGFMRIPKEGVAASNNAYRRFGPPRYRDAMFEYPGGELELEAEMRNIDGGKD